MILVILEQKTDHGLFNRDFFISTGDDYEEAVGAALDASQEAYGGIEQWLEMFGITDRLYITACVTEPDSLVGPSAYWDEFVPQKEWVKRCSCCGSGLNTVFPCPTCGELICDDCSDGVHICDPE